MSKLDECLAEALPCPHCGCADIHSEWGWFDESFDETREQYGGRFYCAACGASTRGVPLGTSNHKCVEDAFNWKRVLAAWNIRATMPPSMPSGGGQ